MSNINRPGWFFILLLMVMSLAFAGCSLLFPDIDDEDSFDSDEEETLLIEPTTELGELVWGNNAFAFDFYQAVREGDENLFYSPYSISLGCAMFYAGAKGETAAQMEEALHFTLGQEQLHPTFETLAQDLASRTELPDFHPEKGLELNVANAMWTQMGYPLLPSFVGILDENYGAEPNYLDFLSDPETSRTTINTWVSDQTEGEITDLFPPGSVTSDTRLVLANAIYYNAKWLHPFAETETKEWPFYLENDDQITAPTMMQEDDFLYFEGDNYQAIELPYQGETFAMIVVLPQGITFDAFADDLSAAWFQEIILGLRSSYEQKVFLAMPKFTYDSTFSLQGILSSLGMLDAFGPSADFSGLDSTGELFIDAAYHKAYVLVDEQGTVAAGGSGFTGVLCSPIDFIVDHPFFFAIYDIETQAILFMGRVLDPRG